ncbi:MAG TPA: type III pantothenate kinase [Magnetospirillaceae bacterium]|nr:type III pantothenate kinase [Magnetospirillaceae bacterium]
MLMAIDIGNTNIVGGVYDGTLLRETLRIRTVSRKTEDEYVTVFRAILFEKGVDPATVDRVIVSSVVPALTGAIAAMSFRLFRSEPVVLGPSHYSRLPIRVIAQDEIGTDLVADAVAAYDKVRGACIVVDFGTALTFTCVSCAGEILGVAIAPGLGTAVGALSRDTAQLPNVPLTPPPSVLGLNTVQAIQSGVVLGYTGLVEHIVREMRREAGGSAQVLATGGLCRVVAQITKVFDYIEPDLTLDGLAIIAGLV